MSQYTIHLINFERWMKIVNYAESTIESILPRVTGFLEYLGNKGIRDIKEVKEPDINEYYNKLTTRQNKKTGGALSDTYIRGNITSVKIFSKYLKYVSGINLNIKISHDTDIPERTILTKAEIKALFKACEYDSLMYRDKAMLSLYYGCGLRRNEGISLNVEDILFDKSLIFIRNGKGRKQRYVPMSEEVMKNIENYIIYQRGEHLKTKNIKSLLLTIRGKRPEKASLGYRFKTILKRSEINKNISLHALRHSIATHLLQSGMSLENISKFLGHKSLESTQVYTHIKYK